VHAAWGWLSELLERVEADVPAVTEAEFADLAEWFSANEDRVRGLCPRLKGFELGYGMSARPENIQYFLHQGPRVHGAGKVAEAVRRLKSCASEV
jgi:hypothetical protein